MKNISLTIGHNVNGAHKWNINNVTAAVSLTLELEAFTAVPCFGMWKGEAEESTRIEVCNLTEDQAQFWSSDILTGTQTDGYRLATS